MAKIGIRHPACGLYKELNNAASYSGGMVIGKAMKVDAQINSNDVKLYADDDVAESDKSFKDGKVGVGVDDLSYPVQAMVLGHRLSSTGNGIEANDGDVAPFVGFGFYGPVIKNNVRSFRALIFKKVQFAEPSESLQTKGETVTFQTPTIEGTIFKDVTGNWKKEELFPTESEAEAWIDSTLGVEGICAVPVPSVTAGEYATQQQVALASSTQGAKIYYTVNGTTPSQTNGTLYATPITVADTKMIRAIAVKDGMKGSTIFAGEYTITA